MIRASDSASASDQTGSEAFAACLDRIDRYEAQVQAFAAFDPDRVRHDIAHANHRGRLAGQLIAVKDVFDTSDYPTEYFSPIYAGRQPLQDAWIVSRLKAEGAVVIGKSHTAEFAYSHTGPTRNPHDLQRTPGSSSAGSAAGLAAGFFPLALGTQTAGSILKPASYCGVFGFKPTFNSIPLTGVLSHAPSFDTAGWFARSIGGLAALAEVLLPAIGAVAANSSHRLGWCDTPYAIDPEVDDALTSARLHLAQAGWTIPSFELPPALTSVAADHVIVNEAEAVRSLSEEIARHPRLVSREVHDAATRVAARGPEEEKAARERLYRGQVHIRDIFSRFDIVLAPTCGIVAPIGLRSTGPSDHIRLWTAFGLPMLTLPLPRQPDQLPVGLQLVGAPGADASLLQIARGLAEALNVAEVAIVDPA